MDAHLLLPIADASQTGSVRREATALAAALGLDSADAGRVALVATELATNILKHAERGQVLLRPLRELTDRPGVELIALDKGPGMADLARCMQDGYSTAGSPGTGLGALSRLASFLDVYTVVGQGTAVLARVLPRGAREVLSADRFVAGAVRVPAPGEQECGDSWALAQSEGRGALLVVDGLGHGAQAAVAAGEAVRAFEASSHLPADQILVAVHRALLATRGAAGSVAEVDLDRGEVRYAGMGNVAGFVAWAGGSRSMVGQNGTLGGQSGRVRMFPYPWPAGAALVLYTDGLTSHVSLQAYPGLLARHPSVVAGVLFRDFFRGRDDATVVVVREARA